MKELLLIYAKYTQRSNAAVISILDKLSETALNKDRKSYYKNLSGIVRHIFGGIIYFHGIIRTVIPALSSVLKATDGLSIPESERLSTAEWSELKRIGTVCNQATVESV
jgi:hypothetical protein